MFILCWNFFKCSKDYSSIQWSYTDEKYSVPGTSHWKQLNPQIWAWGIYTKKTFVSYDARMRSPETTELELTRKSFPKLFWKLLRVYIHMYLTESPQERSHISRVNCIRHSFNSNTLQFLLITQSLQLWFIHCANIDNTVVLYTVCCHNAKIDERQEK